MKKIALLFLVLTMSYGVAQENQTINTQAYTEGLHYTELSPSYDTDNKEQVIVYEFFGYKCPHCSNFQAFMKPWHKQQPKFVKLVRIPVIFQPGWDILAKAYYTAETMGIAEQTHQAMFDAIHKQRKKFNSIEDLADWYAESFNVDRDAFISTANSFMIDSKIRQSNNLMRKMQITSTPAIVINGKYKPNKKELGTNNALLEMTSYLARQEAMNMGLIK